MEKIRIGIVGYGNLGRGIEIGLANTKDMDLVGIFSRRDPSSLQTDSPSYRLDDILNFKDQIDVLILASGSAKDIPNQGPDLARTFNTIDAYDNHSLMTDYYQSMDKVCKENKTTSIIATGWDPGLFSLKRILSEAILPQGQTYTFWGRGLSQGHSDALRRIDGVRYAAQYTLPNEEMVERIREGKDVSYTGKTAHKRDCYVVLEDGADEIAIQEEIVSMPDYFLGYETRVNFITEEEYFKNHTAMAHGGRVLRQGSTSPSNLSVYEFSLKLDSNPEFTAAVNIAYARACHRLNKKGHIGALTVADIPPALLSPRSREEIIKDLI